MSNKLPTLNDLSASGKTVLVRADLNVPMEGGRIADITRLKRTLPTLQELSAQGARVVILSHFGRPNGKFVASLSLSPLVDALSAAMDKEVKFGVDCIGNAVKETISSMQAGDIVLLENLRFHPEEEANDPEFTKKLSELGDIYVNDAFSCSHRAHASIVGITEYLPSYAGRLVEQEVTALTRILSEGERPIAAIIGGSKISTKLKLLENLSGKMDYLIIGGAMANTFLHAQGHAIGKSLCEEEMKNTALKILKNAKEHSCEIILPSDVVAASALNPHAANIVCAIDKVPADSMIVDIGPETTATYREALNHCRMAVWNGPAGAFETSPFDGGTVQVARMLAAFSHAGKLQTIAGGGDTVSAVSHSGLSEAFTYLSTAGGAFLEWLEGKTLPGIAALEKAGISNAKRASA